MFIFLQFPTLDQVRPCFVDDSILADPNKNLTEHLTSRIRHGVIGFKDLRLGDLSR
jgi:hypothetical protein